MVLLKRFLFCTLLATCLTSQFTTAFAADDAVAAKAKEDSRNKALAVALNYCRASFHRIKRNPIKPVLFEEQEKILNNLNLNGIADEKIIKLYTSVLDEVAQVQILEKERKHFKNSYKYTFRKQIFASVFSMGLQAATLQVASAVRTGANSWWDYRNMAWNREQKVWGIEKARIKSVVSKSSQFLDTFWKMTQTKNIPDNWLVRGDDLDNLDEALREEDLEVRLRVLKRMEKYMECYPPYWYYLGRTQQSLGQLFAAAQTYDTLANLAAGHFRRDEMLTAGLANRAMIQEYLGQPGSVRTALEALRYTTTVPEANLMCAHILMKHGRYEEAEDAILRNLDTDLERDNSLMALLSLYYQSDNHEKLIAQLNRPDVVRDLQMPVLLLCAAKLGAKKTPALAARQLITSFYAYPNLNFGKDDFIVAAAATWRLDLAQMSLLWANQRLDNPQIRSDKNRQLATFVGQIELGTPFNRLQDPLTTVVSLKYPNMPVIRIHLAQQGSVVLTEKPADQKTQPAALTSPHPEALRMVFAEVGDVQLSLRGPFYTVPAANVSSKIVPKPSKTETPESNPKQEEKAESKAEVEVEFTIIRQRKKNTEVPTTSKKEAGTPRSTERINSTTVLD